MTRSGAASAPPDSAQQAGPGQRRRWWPAAVIATVIAISVTFLVPAGRHQWAISIFRQPTHYTALAIKYAWLLPSTKPLYSRVPLFFTVSNQQGEPLRYRYVVRELDPLGNVRQLGSGAKTVAAGATWTVDTSVRPSCSLSPCEIQITLPGHPETADFLLTLTAGTGRAGKPRSHGHRPRT
jgi:hypothetical protein